MQSALRALLAAALVSAAALPAAAWQPASPSAAGVTWVERDPMLPSGLYAATTGGLFRSADAGDSWRLLDARPLDRLATSPADPQRLYAVDREDTFVFGVYRSDDGGASFDRVSELLGGGFSHQGLEDLAVDPADADRLFASLTTRPLELATFSTSDVLRSTDGGHTWQSIRWFPASTEQGAKVVRDLAVAATDGERLYAATHDGLFRSDDGGDTWSEVRGGAWTALAVDPLDENHLVAAGGAEGVIWSSRDGGASWQRADAGLPDHVVRDLRFDPIDRSVLYAALEEFETVSAGRVFVSQDGGSTWSPVDQPLDGPIGPLAVTATSPRRIFAVARRELFRTAFALPLCPERATALCLHDDRFLVEVVREDFEGGRGPGFAAPLTADAGTFWFFEPDNVELAVKVLDARTVNDHWWVFFGSLTNVAFDLRLTDLATSRTRLYHSPSRHFASRGDTAAFPAVPAVPGGAAPAAAGPAPAWFLMLPGSDVAGACADDATTLCLLDRFRVSVSWQDPTGHGGPGQARPLTDETGWFWFFDDDNPELFVKVLDGRAVNGHWWVFYASLTNVAFDLVVEDAVGGGRATYRHPGGTFASHGDTAAIP